MPNYVSKIKPNGLGGTEYTIKDAELREVVQAMQDEVAGTQTATGNPITITDGSETYAQGLSVGLEPKQDLHGYDFPWVGGAGKNKLPIENYTPTYNSVASDGLVTEIINTFGTSYANSTFRTRLSAGRYNAVIYVINATGAYGGSAILKSDNTRLGSIALDNKPSNTKYSTDFTLDTDSDIGITIKPYGGSVYVAVYPYSEEIPNTYAPYSNICPISGYEGVEVTTADSDTDPTQSRTASVTFGQTVYGGSVDLTTGVLTVDRAFVEFDGSSDETWNRYSQGSASAYAMIGKLSELCKGADESIVIKANELKSISYNSTFGNYDAFISNGDVNPSSLFITGVRSITTLNDWRTFLANNPLQVCYELAVPITIQLKPQELKLLQDTNNITTNGTTITLDYIPNNSIGDAVKASEEYTDRAVGRVAPKATLIDTWMISEEADTISVDLSSYDCNFFLLEYLFNSKRGTTLIPRPSGGSFSASVVTYNNGTAYYVELTYNPTTKELAYTSNVTSQFGILAIYTI